MNLLGRIAEIIAPRSCAECGCRLAPSEDALCGHCNLHLPRTFHSSAATDNEMARLFWGLMPLERASAMFFYQAHAPASNIIYNLKYRNHPETGGYMGMMEAREFAGHGFFEGVDMIVPVPLSKSRQRERGYNQSEEIAGGVAFVTGLPVVRDAVIRKSFTVSQTELTGWQRRDNVKDSFGFSGKVPVSGCHVLIVDDVVTTGATVTECASELVKAGAARISVMSLGFTKG